MFCSNCGTQMPDEAKVCHVCGKVVEPVNPEQPTPAMPPQPPKKSKGALPFIAIIAAVLIDFFWTKSSLEDLSGKEVSTSTVIWTMMKTNNRK